MSRLDQTGRLGCVAVVSWQLEPAVVRRIEQTIHIVLERLLHYDGSYFVDLTLSSYFWTPCTFFTSPARKLLKLTPLPQRSASLVAIDTRTAPAATHPQQFVDALQTKVAQLEAQLRRQFAEFAQARQNPSPVARLDHPAIARPPALDADRYPNGHHRSAQANERSHDGSAGHSQQADHLFLGAMDRRDSAPTPPFRLQPLL